MTWPLGWTILPSLISGGDCRAECISADGTVIGGQAWDATRDNSYAAYWTEAGIVNAGRLSPADGGDPDEDVAQFAAASQNGATLVGTSDGVGNNGIDDGFWQAIRWASAGGMQNISPPIAGFNEASSVSADGATVAGYTQVTPGSSTSYRCFIWTPTAGIFIVPLPTGFTFAQWCKISPNGQWLLGGTGYTGGALFRWSSSTGSVAVTDTRVSLGYTTFPIIGDDGVAWVAGQLTDPNRNARLWRITGTFEETDLGVLPGGDYAYGLTTNRSGSAVAGYADTAAGDVVAMYWTAATGMVGIPPPAGYHDPYPAEDEGLSADGTIFAGYITDDSGVEHAFVYRVAPPVPPQLGDGLTFSELETCTTLPAPSLTAAQSNFCACPPCHEILTLCRPRDTFVVRPERKC